MIGQPEASSPLLSIRDLEVWSSTSGQRVPVLRGVDVDVRAGEAVGLVGESGSGKSMTLRAIMRQLPAAFEASGSMTFRGEEISQMRSGRLARFRSDELGMIYQDPRAHINPLWTVGDFLTEAVVVSGRLRKREALARAKELLEEVGFRDPAGQMRQYPGQLSGGLLQRVMIVAALMPEPALVLADEPTTALDVTVQAEVMSIFADVIRTHGVGLVFVTHDLDLAAATTDRMSVMYAGRIVETGPSDVVSTHPTHPYTSALLASRPSLHRRRALSGIPGQPASAASAGPGCSFAERCGFVQDACWSHGSALEVVDAVSASACLRTPELRTRLKRSDA